MVMVMVMNDLLPPPLCKSALPFWDTAISTFDHENQWSRSCVVTFVLQNSKVKVMVMVKPIGHIWGLEFNRYACFSFCGNRTNFGWDIGNSIFDLENSRSRSRPKSDQVIYRPRPTIAPKMKEIQKVVQKLSREQESAAGGSSGRGVRTGTKT